MLPHKPAGGERIEHREGNTLSEIGDQGFAAVPNFVWRDEALAGPLALFCLLRYRGDNETGESWWSHAAMADDLGVTKRTIIRWLQVLEEKQLITVSRRSSDGIQTTNLYTTVGVLGVSKMSQRGVPEMSHELTNIVSLPIDTNDQKNNEKPQMFDEFWRIFPNKRGKTAARKAWQKAVKKVPSEYLYDKARAFADDPNLPEARFVCYAATWLNQERWDDPPFPERTRGRAVSEDVQRGRATLRALREGSNE